MEPVRPPVWADRKMLERLTMELLDWHYEQGRRAELRDREPYMDYVTREIQRWHRGPLLGWLRTMSGEVVDIYGPAR